MNTKVEIDGRKSCSRRSAKLSKSRLRKLFLLSTEDECTKQWRTGIVKATVRKYIRYEQKKRQLAKAKDHFWAENGADMTSNMADECRGRIAQQPRGAMAPKNTTQYLMDIVYDDLQVDTCDHFRSHEESTVCETSVCNTALSPMSVYASLDSAYESYFAFQQRDFEETFHHYGSSC